ncbi:MAG: ABC transporter ATP-binding protein [Clostridiales bacterium]|jgi:ABC-2 type transport system ATP-binding protein|nr:ABC transporter ATP-binding protein [Clostridiales bacterium]
MVEINNLTKRYGNITAVNNLSFTVSKNEILGFLGPNGAGKTTTMNMITGCLPPTSGTIIVNGFDISKNPMEAKKSIGYLPEIPPLYTDMKVYEYLKFVAGLKSVPRSQRNEQIRDAMDRLKISDVSKRLIKNLSKGYKQRVGFAQALLGNPEILILDEPTVGLDPNQILEVRKLIKDLKKDHTIILCSHILQEISAVCDKALIIAKGEMKALDTLKNLSARVSSNIALTITVEGDKAKIIDIFNQTKEVLDYTEISSDKPDAYSFKVELLNDDARKKTISKLIAEDCSVLEVQTDHASLEQVFVKLTKQPSKKRTIHDVFDEIEKDIEKDMGSDDNKEA